MGHMLNITVDKNFAKGDIFGQQSVRSIRKMIKDVIVLISKSNL